MSLTIGYLLATVAAQAGSAYFNCKRSAKQAKELARKQQEFEERVMREGIENSRHEFDEICSLQREIEWQMQQDRVQLIRDNHRTTLMLEAYRHSLNNWPLFVPPFIIKNESLPLLEIKQKDGFETIAVNCILTPSMDNSFNLKVFPQLEERLAQFFSKYWPTNSIKAVRFYQQAWRNNINDAGARIHDLKAHLSEVPTIVLSPIVDDNKLKFSFSWWGISNNTKDEHILELDNIYDPELSLSISSRMDYTSDMVDTILNVCTPKLAAFICFFADLYYWNFYHLPPFLLGFIVDNFNIPEKQYYYDQYQDILDKSISDFSCIHRYPERLIEFAGMFPSPSQREKLILSICSKHYIFSNQDFHSIDDFLGISFTYKDINILNDIKRLFPIYSEKIDRIIKKLTSTTLYRDNLSNGEKYGRIATTYCSEEDTILNKPHNSSKYNY